MSRDAILRVQATEQRAAEILREARALAQEKRQNAQADGEALCRKAEAEAMEKRAELLSQIAAKTEELNLHSMEEAQAEADEIRRDVRLRRKIAEKIIIRGLDSKCR